MPPPGDARDVSYFARLHWRLRSRLPMWTVYMPTTRDYPGRYVARMFVTLPESKPTRFVLLHDTLEGLRELLPPGLLRIHRDPSDDPVILEVWL